MNNVPLLHHAPGQCTGGLCSKHTLVHDSRHGLQMGAAGALDCSTPSEGERRFLDNLIRTSQSYKRVSISNAVYIPDSSRYLCSSNCR
jgi:hypothetical protein